MKRFFISLTLTSMILPAYADSVIELSGNLGVNNRYYWQEPQFNGQQDDHFFDMHIEPELSWTNEDDLYFKFTGFAREGNQDGGRNHLDIREMYLSYDNDDYNLTLGFNKVFWGVVESWHLVDVLNQTDLVENIDQEDKLGQPMVNLNFSRDWGSMSLFWLPYFRERTFPEIQGRLRTPYVVDTERAEYETSAGQQHQDFAVRYSHYIEDVDFGVYWFHGLDREPYLKVADIQGSHAQESEQVMVPVYLVMDQIGVDLQYTVDAWLWKFEAIANSNDHEDYFASVLGFEYNVYQLANSSADLGLLIEYLHSGKRFSNKPLFDDDIFIGSRLVLNNTQDTSFLLGAIVDMETQETLVNFKGESRVTEDIFVELSVNWFTNAGGGIDAYQQDSYVEMTASWFF